MSNSQLERDINKLIATANALMERYARSMEEIDGIRLMLEEARELLLEHFEENSRGNDRLSEKIDRLERLAILERTHSNPTETQDLRKQIKAEHNQRDLRQKLIEKQEQLAQWSRNAERLKLRIAKYDKLEDHNKLDDAEYNIAELSEDIKQIRQELG